MLFRYSAAFAQLHNAAVADADAVPDIQDPKQNLAASSVETLPGDHSPTLLT